MRQESFYKLQPFPKIWPHSENVKRKKAVEQKQKVTSISINFISNDRRFAISQHEMYGFDGTKYQPEFRQRGLRDLRCMALME